jgi:bifunctional oligoribonuclease and PAP phosphatase NrnA
MGIKKIVRAIKDKKNRCFLISTHQNMEGDALGSMLALRELLKTQGKRVVLFPPEDVPDMYRFLPNAALVKRKQYIDESRYDIACLVDCTDPGRLGTARDGLSSSRPIINIDHHISNTRFGQINWVEPGMSCSGEQIYHLFKEMKAPINKKAALYMYIAILTDTGSFRYSNTRSITHMIAADLISHGIDPNDIYRRIYEEIKQSRLKFLSSALSTLNTTRDGAIAWIRITKRMLEKHSACLDDAQDFINFPRAIKGVKIAVAFKEINKNKTKVTLRSNDGVDVNDIAKFFDGGGHLSASGCVIDDGIGKAEKMVIERARSSLRA